MQRPPPLALFFYTLLLSLFVPTSTFCIPLLASKITIRTIGKRTGGDSWLGDAFDQYATRLRPSLIELSTEYLKNDEDLSAKTRQDLAKGHSVILLDPLGATITSEAFSANLYSSLASGGSRLTFVIGGAVGLPDDLSSDSSLPKLSLSKLTFTHQFARVLLAEQIYRASEIRKGERKRARGRASARRSSSARPGRSSARPGRRALFVHPIPPFLSLTST